MAKGSSEAIKNLPSAASVFSREAGLNPVGVAVQSRHGFLLEWWSMLWDAYCTKVRERQLSTLEVVHMVPYPRSTWHSQECVNIDIGGIIYFMLGHNIGARLHESLFHQLFPRAPRILPRTVGLIGRARVADQVPSHAHSLIEVGQADNTPVQDQEEKSIPSSAHYQQDTEPLDQEESPACSAHYRKDQAISNSGSSTGSNSEKIDLEIENNSETKKCRRNCIANTLPSTGRASPETDEPQGFPFTQYKGIRPTREKLTCCDFSTMGDIVVAAGDEKKVYIWHLDKLTRCAINGHSKAITDICFKPYEDLFATSSLDKTVKMWDANPGYSGNPSGKLLCDLIGHGEHVTSLDFYPRNTRILCSCDINEIKFWNVTNANMVTALKQGGRHVRFNCSGRYLAVAVGNMIELIDMQCGIVLGRLKGHVKEVRSMCWDQTGLYIASVSEESARVWDVMLSGQCVHELFSGGNRFESCTFHPGNCFGIVLGSYKLIEIWTPRMGNRTWRFPAHEDIVSDLASTPFRKMIASVGHDQCLKLWK